MLWAAAGVRGACEVRSSATSSVRTGTIPESPRKSTNEARQRAKAGRSLFFLLDFPLQESVCGKRKWDAFRRDFRAVARQRDPTLPELTLQPASLRFAGLCQWQHPMLSFTQGRARWLPANRSSNPPRPYENHLAPQGAPLKPAAPPDQNQKHQMSPLRRWHRRKRLPVRRPNRKQSSRCCACPGAPRSPRS